MLQYEDITLLSDVLKLKGTKGESLLAKREMEMLSLFIVNKEKLLTKEYIYNHIWGIDGEVENASLDIYLHFVRRHLKMVSDKVIITTIRKVGYIMEKADG